MKRNRWIASAVLAGLAFGSALLAQPTGNNERNRQGMGNRANRMERSNQRFLEVDPKVGDPLPDATGYLEDRQPVSLSDLKGSYTVIVFGCLT